MTRFTLNRMTLIYMDFVVIALTKASKLLQIVKICYTIGMKYNVLALIFVVSFMASFSVVSSCLGAHNPSIQEISTQQEAMPCHSEIPTDTSHEQDHCEGLCLCDYISPAPDRNPFTTIHTFDSLLLRIKLESSV